MGVAQRPNGRQDSGKHPQYTARRERRPHSMAAPCQTRMQIAPPITISSSALATGAPAANCTPRRVVRNGTALKTLNR